MNEPAPTPAATAKVLLATASRGLPETWKMFLAQVAAGKAPEEALAEGGTVYGAHGTALFEAICKDREIYLQWKQPA